MASIASIGYTTTITYGDPPDGSANAGSVLQARNFSGLTSEADDVDITNFDSPGGFREFIGGMVDPGEATLELIYNETQYKELLGILREQKFWTIELPKVNPASLAGTKITFLGFLKAVGVTVPTDDAITSDATIRVGGEIVIVDEA